MLGSNTCYRQAVATLDKMSSMSGNGQCACKNVAFEFNRETEVVDITIQHPKLIKLIKKEGAFVHALTCQQCHSEVCELRTRLNKTYASFISDSSIFEVSFQSDTPDFYQDGDYLVFTEMTHLKRGHCCNSGCRHCPYQKES